jgi:hypothetical protein
MMKLQVANIRTLSASLAATEQLSSKQLCDIKGGCSSCEDKRRPPRNNGGRGRGNDDD